MPITFPHITLPKTPELPAIPTRAVDIVLYSRMDSPKQRQDVEDYLVKRSASEMAGKVTAQQLVRDQLNQAWQVPATPSPLAYAIEKEQKRHRPPFSTYFFYRKLQKDFKPAQKGKTISNPDQAISNLLITLKIANQLIKQIETSSLTPEQTVLIQKAKTNLADITQKLNTLKSSKPTRADDLAEMKAAVAVACDSIFDNLDKKVFEKLDDPPLPAKRHAEQIDYCLVYDKPSLKEPLHIILYVSGNAGSWQSDINSIKELHQLFPEAVIVGWNPPGVMQSRSSQSIDNQDQLIAPGVDLINHLCEHLPNELLGENSSAISNEQITLWGQSLGGGLVTQIAAKLVEKNPNQMPQLVICRSFSRYKSAAHNLLDNVLGLVPSYLLQSTVKNLFKSFALDSKSVLIQHPKLRKKAIIIDVEKDPILQSKKFSRHDGRLGATLQRTLATDDLNQPTYITAHSDQINPHGAPLCTLVDRHQARVLDSVKGTIDRNRQSNITHHSNDDSKISASAKPSIPIAMPPINHSKNNGTHGLLVDGFKARIFPHRKVAVTTDDANSEQNSNISSSME